MQQNDEYIMKIVVARNMLNNSKCIIVYYYTNSLFICEIFTSRQVFKIKVEYI